LLHSRAMSMLLPLQVGPMPVPLLPQPLPVAMGLEVGPMPVRLLLQVGPVNMSPMALRVMPSRAG
jgi:hypothetical protein